MSRDFDNSLFYTCSLIEFIGRKQKLKRSEVLSAIGDKRLRHIYNYADVLHCEVIDRVAAEFISSCSIPEGSYDNVSEAKYRVPDYWDIGEVYARLIEDVSGEDKIETMKEVYASEIGDAISNYNTDFYYQPRDYIRECYLAGEIIDG